MSQAGGRIVGGDEVDGRKYPWQVLLRRPDGATCGASVIAPRWVLTAAHCVFTFSSLTGRVTHLNIFTTQAPLRLYFGSNQAEGGTLANVTTKDVFIHHDYCPAGRRTARCVAKARAANADADIALIHLPRSVINDNSSARVTAIGYATPAVEQQWLEPSTPVTVTGWGLYDLKAAQPNADQRLSSGTSDKLREVTVEIETREKCRQQWLKADGARVSENMLCAIRDGKDSCGGDSGGPLIVNTPGLGVGFTQVGIVSWGPRNCGSRKDKLPGVYTRISRYTDWIEMIRDKR